MPATRPPTTRSSSSRSRMPRRSRTRNSSRSTEMRSVIAALVLLAACQSAVGQGITLRYAQAYSALRSIFALPLLVAERNGYFIREGLDFSMLPVPGGGEKLIAALHDGTADISHVATPFLIQAALAGSDAVAIAAEFNN